MRKIFWLFLVAVLLFSGVIVAALSVPALRDPACRFAIEAAINSQASEYFASPVRLNRVQFTRDGELQLFGLKAELLTPEGVFPVQVSKIQTAFPVAEALRQNPLKFDFEEAKPLDSESAGMEGSVTFFGPGRQTMHLESRIVGLELSELSSLNPETLRGASGPFSGSLEVMADARGLTGFTMNLIAGEKGGKVQARFFDLFLNFLPQTNRNEVLERLAGVEIVPFREAKMTMSLASPEIIKAFVHVLIPAYNLNLNLNAEIRLEAGSSFVELADTLGLIEVKSS